LLIPRAMRWVLTTSLFLSLAASAQSTGTILPDTLRVALPNSTATTGTTGSSTIVTYTGQSASFGADACNGTLDLEWQAYLLRNVCGSLNLWATTGECGDGPGTGDFSYPSITSVQLATRRGGFTIKYSDLPGFAATADGGSVCGSQGTTVVHHVCAGVLTSSAGVSTCTTTRGSPVFTLTYDTQPPVAPIIETITSRDTSLQVDLSVSSDTNVAHVEVKAPGTDTWVRKASVSPASTTRAVVTGLANNIDYAVRAIAEDEAGNESAPSEEKIGRPIHTDGFWASYRHNGGEDQGCSAGGGLLLSSGALALAFWLSRVKR